jgi:hypothetical protein
MLAEARRVPVVLVGLGVVVAILVGYQIKKQQAAAVPRRQLEIVVGVAKPIVKDLDVKLAYTADVLPLQQVSVFSKVKVGIVVSNGVLLVEYINELRRRGAAGARSRAARGARAPPADPHDRARDRRGPASDGAGMGRGD